MKHLLALLMLLCTLLPAMAATAPSRPAPAKVTGPATVRVLVALGPSTYFFRDGRPHGVEHAWLQDFEKFANTGRDKTHQIRLKYVPVEAGELIPALFDGRGEMAAGLIPASDGLRQLVALTEPLLTDQWCALGGKDARLPSDLDALAQQTVRLPMSSFGRRLLLDINTERRLAGKEEISIDDAPIGTTNEQLLADAHDGSDSLTLGSRFVASLWSKVFPRARLGTCLNEAVPIVWAVQRDQTGLLADLNRFITSKKSQLIKRATDLTRPHLRANGVGKPSQTIDPLGKLAFFAPVFQLAASANDLDWLLLAAIGQRESGLSAVKSQSGPTGVMQVDPATARKMGVKDPHDTRQNVTAAARYLGYLRDMFSKPGIAAEDQLYFMLAAYNAGEGRLQGLRNQAAAEGLDPNRWHGHVEVVAKRSVGEKLLNYVTAVSRYYSAYQAAERNKQLDSTRTASKPVAAR